MERSIRDVAGALLAALLAATHGVLAQSEPSRTAESQQASPRAADTQMTTCFAPVATVIVIEVRSDTGSTAQGGMPHGGMMGGGMMMGPDQYARLRIPALAHIARGVADRSGCFQTLESDPALLALPGGVQPELVLRVRATLLNPMERSLIEKGVDAARRYVGRYLGGGESGPDSLQTVQVSLDLICPKQRRVVQEFSGYAERPAGDAPSANESVDAIAAANRERVTVAYTMAQNAALIFLRSKPRPCD